MPLATYHQAQCEMRRQNQKGRTLSRHPPIPLQAYRTVFWSSSWRLQSLPSSLCIYSPAHLPTIHHPSTHPLSLHLSYILLHPSIHPSSTHMFNYLSHPTPTCPLLLTCVPPIHLLIHLPIFAPPIWKSISSIHQYIPPSTHLLIIHLLTHLSLNPLSTPSIDCPQRLPIYPSTHTATSHLSPFHLLSIHPSIHPPPFCLFTHPSTPIFPFIWSIIWSTYYLHILPLILSTSYECARLTVEAWGTQQRANSERSLWWSLCQRMQYGPASRAWA